MSGEQNTPKGKELAYLAGPMRGIPEYNFPAFYAAAAALRERGFEVWSPAEHDVHQDGFDPTKDKAQPMRYYMKRDLPAVLGADFVAVLPGWESSQGATCEVMVARACGIPVKWAHDLSTVSESGQGLTPRTDALRKRYEGTSGSFTDALRLCEQLESSRSAIEPTEEMVWQAATVLANSPLIEAPKLSVKSWLGLARAALEAAMAPVDSRSST